MISRRGLYDRSVYQRRHLPIRKTVTEVSDTSLLRTTKTKRHHTRVDRTEDLSTPVSLPEVSPVRLLTPTPDDGSRYVGSVAFYGGRKKQGSTGVHRIGTNEGATRQTPLCLHPENPSRGLRPLRLVGGTREKLGDLFSLTPVERTVISILILPLKI